MSHAIGAIKFKDGTLRFYEYDGTSDVVLSHHYATTKEVRDNWRNGSWLYCECGSEEDVMLYSSYGYGFYIEGKACKTCKSVHTLEYDFDVIECDETEDWEKKIDWNNSGWIKKQ